MEAALKRAQEVKKDAPQVLPVIVLPNDDDNGYLAQKAHFSHAGMPTQVCTLQILEDQESVVLGSSDGEGGPGRRNGDFSQPSHSECTLPAIRVCGRAEPLFTVPGRTRRQ
jgi:hypothetical protein